MLLPEEFIRRLLHNRSIDPGKLKFNLYIEFAETNRVCRIESAAVKELENQSTYCE